MRLLERDIERTCSDWLALDGWRMLKTDPVSDRSRGKGFGELGMADCLYLRYCYSGEACSASPRLTGAWDAIARVKHTQAVWIEWKRPGYKATARQTMWHMSERALGALTWIAGEDFPTSIEGFQAFYRQSGLMRRQI